MSAPACPACAEPLPDGTSLRGRDRVHGLPGTFEVRVCATCRSGRTLPLVSPEEIESLYPTAYNAYRLPANPLLRVAATGLYRWRYWRSLRGGLLHLLRDLPPGRLLDVGSGRGDLGVILTSRGWDVTGLEPSETACAEALARGVSSICGTLTTIAERLPGEYDVVVFQHSLEHVAEPADDLAVTRALLRDGGHLLVSVPNFGSWQRKRFGSEWFHLDLPRHRSHFSRKGLELLLARTGFSDIAITTSTNSDGLPMSLQYRLLGRRRLQRGRALYAGIAVTLLLAPVTAGLNAIEGEGDVLDAVATKRGAEARA